MARSWARFLVAALVAAIAAAALGVTAQAVVLSAVVLAATAFMLHGVRNNAGADPFLWYGLSGTGALFLLAGTIAEMRHGGPTPTGDYPQLNDYVDAVAYLLAIVSMYRVVRVRSRHSDPTSLLDSVIVPGGIVVMVWVTVLVPSIENTELSELGRALEVVFAVLSVTLTAVIGQFLLSPTRRSTAFYLLGVGAVGALAGSVLASVELSGRTLPGLEPTTMLIPTVGFAAVGAAALHPTMASVTQPSDEAIPALTPIRLAALSAAAVIAPTVLLFQVLRDTPSYAPIVVIVMWILLITLIMVRMAGLVRARERVAASDRILAESAEALVAATDAGAMYEAALAAIDRIVDTERTTIFSLEDDQWTVGASRGSRSGDVTVVDEDFGRNGSAFATTMRGRRAETHPAVAAPDLRGSISEHCTVAPLFAAGQLTGAIIVTTLQQPGRQERATISSLASDLSLAVEGAARAERVFRRRSERRFSSLIENSADLVIVVDDELVPTFITPAVTRTLGFDETTLGATPLVDHVSEEDKARFVALLSDHPSTPTSIEIRVEDAVGSLRWFDVVASDLRHDPYVAGIVVTARDIHGRKLADERTALTQARFRSLVQQSSDIVAVLNVQGDVTYASPSVESILGHRADDIEGTPVFGLIHPDHRETAAAFIGRVIEDPDAPHTIEIDVLAVDGAVRTLGATARNLDDDPAINGIVINAHDITERIKLERSLRHQALHDDLTGIPNRNLFRDRVEQALTRRNPGMSAVMLLDLDDFRTVNDSLGHQAGDDLLKILAFRLRQVLRVGDTAARMGGDEFAILVEDAQNRDTVLEIAERVLSKVAEPFDIGPRELTVEASVGIVFDDDITNATAETMIRSADAAMHAAKARGKANFTVYEEAMYLGAMDRLHLKADLVQALERDELHLHYQPIVDLADGALTGYEALLRWSHAERGPVSPGDFIPLAEESGLIVPIGLWVLQQALRQLEIWQPTRGRERSLTMSVNLSPRQLEDEDVVDAVANALATSGVEPSLVSIELTETASLAENGVEATRLCRIRELGCDINADDFGSGYASYASLRHLPFTGVKIDRSLIDGISGPEAEQAQAQVRSIIDMAAKLDLKVIAEGIENAAQVDALRTMGCRYGQGYFFARPSASGELDRDPSAVDAPGG